MNVSPNFSPERFLHFLNDQEKGYESESLVSDFTGLYATKKITIPVPYTLEFLEQLVKYMDSYGIAKKLGIADISGWSQKFRKACQENYRAWKQTQNTDRISSYFVAIEGQSGFIGELKTQYDVTISFNNVIGISSSYLNDYIKESLNLVKYYLITRHQIAEEWLSITQYISLDWKKSLLQEFSALEASSGESFCFLFCALFYASILRKLASDGKIVVIQEGKRLKAEEIRIPQDILMTGSFDFAKVPDTSIRHQKYQSIPTKPVDGILLKEKTANYINQIEPETIRKFVIPVQSLAEKDKTNKTSGIDRMEVANAEEFFQALFPYQIKPCQKPALFGKIQGKKIFYASSIFLLFSFAILLYFRYFQEAKPARPKDSISTEKQQIFFSNENTKTNTPKPDTHQKEKISPIDIQAALTKGIWGKPLGKDKTFYFFATEGTFITKYISKPIPGEKKPYVSENKGYWKLVGTRILFSYLPLEEDMKSTWEILEITPQKITHLNFSYIESKRRQYLYSIEDINAPFMPWETDEEEK